MGAPTPNVARPFALCDGSSPVNPPPGRGLFHVKHNPS